jgi:hypothetical protein
MALLQDSTYGLLSEAESKGGVPIQIRTDSTLSTLSTVRFSRSAGFPHQILIAVKGERIADYLVVFQAGFLLRMLELDPSQRMLFASTAQASKQIERLLSSARFRNLPSTQFTAIRDQIADGLLTQLRSVPLGMRVDEWIYTNFPSLNGQQRAAIQIQISENAQALSPQVLNTFPAGISDRSAAMSIAQAQFWSDLTGEREFIQPYQQRQQYSMAQALIAAVHDVASAPENDYRLVETWAEKLDMIGWYQWIPYNMGDTTSL